MKPYTPLFLILNRVFYITLFFNLLSSGCPLLASHDNAIAQLNSTNVRFTENKGQITDQYGQPRPDVLFSGETDGLVYHIKANGMHYQLNRVDGGKQKEEPEINLDAESIQQIPGKLDIYRVDINWLGTNPNMEVLKGTVRNGYENFYDGPEGSSPALFVKSYSDITYRNIYEGIDLHFHESAHHGFEYDFIVQPGADYRQIQMEIKGATLEVNSKNELVIKTPFGDIVEGALRIFQGGNDIPANWNVENNIVRFTLAGNYDHSQPLIIDPPVRIWGTYYGGPANDDVSKHGAVDNMGNVYFAGRAASANRIATVGAHQAVSPGGNSFNAFLAKFNPSGLLEWGTYYGSSDGQDWGQACAIDNMGNVYFAGETQSTINIVTPGAHQTLHAGGSALGGRDAFLIKFNSSGVRQWGTYYGGSGDDLGYSCAVDETGDIYLAGITRSPTTSAIATAGAHQETSGGLADAFLVKFNPAGVRQWGTFYGGSNIEEGWACGTDVLGNVFLAGRTKSTNDISTAGAHQATNGGGGNFDAFVVKFTSTGVGQWGTFYGGSDQDYGLTCAVERCNGNVYLAGTTESASGIASAGAHQGTRGGDGDGFIVKFDAVGVRQWGSYYGGAGFDQTWTCTVDNAGNVYMGGNTRSMNNISSIGAYQTTINGTTDGYITSFDMAGAQRWGTYFGGSGSDGVTYCAPDNNGNIYVVGESLSTSGIATNGTHQSIVAGSGDMFLIKFEDDNTVMDLSNYSHTPAVCFGTGTGTAVVNPSGGHAPYSYSWNTVPVQTTNTATGLAAGTYVVTISDSYCDVDSVILIITEPNQLQASISSQTDQLCAGESRGIANATQQGGIGPYSYSWSPSAQTTQSASNLAAGSFSVIVTDNNGCTAEVSTIITEPPVLTVNTINTSNVSCSGLSDGSAEAIAGGGTPSYTFVWFPSGIANISIGSLAAGTYSVTVTDNNGCSVQAVTIITEPPVLSASVGTTTVICSRSDGAATVSPLGGTPFYTYSWNTVPAQLTQQATGLAAGLYSVQVTDANNCTTLTSATVIGVSTVQATFSADKTEGCADLCITFTNTTPNVVSTIWNYGEGVSVPGTPNGNYCYTSAGVYSVSLTITDADGCVAQGTKSNYITVFPDPVALFTSTPNEASILSPLITFTDNSVDALTWKWSFGDAEDAASSQQHPSHEYTDTGYYTVTLVVTNQFGCQDTTESIVRIKEDFTVYIPNSFTPNGDGRNDEFIPIGIGMLKNKYELLIFNRWGELIFKSNDPAKGWDGKVLSQYVQQDTYVWKVTAAGTNGESSNYIGHVNVIQ